MAGATHFKWGTGIAREQMARSALVWIVATEAIEIAVERHIGSRQFVCRRCSKCTMVLHRMAVFSIWGQFQNGCFGGRCSWDVKSFKQCHRGAIVRDSNSRRIMALEAELISDDAQQFLIGAPMRLVAGAAAYRCDHAVGEFVWARSLIVVTGCAFSARWGIDELFLRRSMGVVAVDAADHLHRSVGYGRRFSDVVMTRKAEAGFAVGYQSVERTFVTGAAALGEDRVYVLGQEVFMTFAVGRMAANAVEALQRGAEMGSLEILVIGIVAHDTQIGARLDEERVILRCMWKMACGAIFGSGRVAGVSVGRIEH